MLKILIVDDEPFFLDFMKEFFQTQTVCYELVGTAPDGLKAMALLRSTVVDVIFTDIKMPVMDGLELICGAMELNPDYQFVVLSSYSDFHMVGEAFKLGAKEYALKSEITSGQLEEILQKCQERKAQVEAEAEKVQAQTQRFSEMADQLTALQKIVDGGRMNLRKAFFAEMLAKGWTFSQAREGYGRSFLPDWTPGAALLVRLDGYTGVLRDTWNNDGELLEFALNNILEEVCQGFRQALFFLCRPGEYLFLTGGCEDFELKCRLHEMEETIRRTLRGALLFETIISASNADSRLERSVGALYQEAAAWNSAFFLLGKGQLISQLPAEPIASEEGAILTDFDLLASRFRQLLSERNVAALEEGITGFQIPPAQAGFSQIGQIQALFTRYAFFLREYGSGEEETERFREEMDRFDTYLRDYGDLEEMNAWLKEIVTILLQQEYHSNSLVKRVKRYVLGCYYGDISLTSIAEAMEVNANYLSRAFSKEYGDSLVSYINLVRVQAAAKLLLESNLKNYEIAERVGYQNVEHFSRIFKKIQGQTPGDYRRGASPHT